MKNEERVRIRLMQRRPLVPPENYSSAPASRSTPKRRSGSCPRRSGGGTGRKDKRTPCGQRQIKFFQLEDYRYLIEWASNMMIPVMSVAALVVPNVMLAIRSPTVLVVLISG